MRFTTTMFGLWLLTACTYNAPQPPRPPVSAQQGPGAGGPHAGHDHEMAAGPMHGDHEMHEMHAMHEMHCPMKVAGTTVSAHDSDGAAVLEFETTGDVAELQRRVNEMAAKHDSMECPMMAGHAGGPAAGTATPAASTPPPASNDPKAAMQAEHQLMHSATLSAEPTEKGARLIFRPSDPAQLEQLRVAVHKKAEHMSHGGCGMHAGDHQHPSGATTQG